MGLSSLVQRNLRQVKGEPPSSADRSLPSFSSPSPASKSQSLSISSSESSAVSSPSLFSKRSSISVPCSSSRHWALMRLLWLHFTSQSTNSSVGNRFSSS